MRLTRTTAALALITLFINEARAHVGWGIVLDQHRQIYFADVLSAGTVWKIDMQGRLAPFVIGKHSHGLAIDEANNIYVLEHSLVTTGIVNYHDHAILKAKDSSCRFPLPR